MEPYLKTFMEQIQQDVAEQNRQQKIKAEIEVLKARQKERRVKPLTEQITELMNSLPAAIRNRPWSMTDLVSRLHGKYRDRPHAQGIGAALRALGWKQKRCWSQEFAGVRLWFPPYI